VRRQRGFTLLELMGSLALIGAVSVVAGGFAFHAKETTELGSLYAGDVAETRRALDAVERDLRGARGVRPGANSLVVVTDAGDVAWKLDGHSLLRGDAVLARNVANFRAERRGAACVDVTIELGHRAPHAARTARVATTVFLRAGAENVK